MSTQDHTTAQDGQTLLTQDPATQQLFFDTWKVWAQVAWVLEHDYAIGLSHEPRPAVDVQDARSGNLPGNIPCSAGSQCASSVCAPEIGYRCSSVLVDKSKINPLLQNPQQPNVTQPSGGTGPQGQPLVKGPNNTGPIPVQQDPFTQLKLWAARTDLLSGLGIHNVQNGVAAGAAAVVLLMSSGRHHRGGLL